MGSGPILMSYMRCDSPQLSLLICEQKYEYNKYCTHHNDVGVKCSCKRNSYLTLYMMITDCSHGDMRIPDDSLSGRVDVCINGGWGTICDSHWDVNDVGVVCRQLGYSFEGILYTLCSYSQL